MSEFEKSFQRALRAAKKKRSPSIRKFSGRYFNKFGAAMEAGKLVRLSTLKSGDHFVEGSGHLAIHGGPTGAPGMIWVLYVDTGKSEPGEGTMTVWPHDPPKMRHRTKF